MAYHVSVRKRAGLFCNKKPLHQFLDAWFLNERIIVEASGTRQRKMSVPEGAGD